MGARDYYGCATLEKEELLELETDIDHQISVEYYRTEQIKYNKFNMARKMYGIEVIKKDYSNKQVPYIERHVSQFLTKDIEKAENILNLLKINKVMPVHVDEIIQDLKQM